jgi:hypothetical protein
VLAAPAAAPADDATGAASAIDLAEAVAAIVEMRHRTRLLTQSYVLSNLGAVVAARAPGAPSESTARALIDRLVEEGAIRVDREPQEVDVNGAKHRVRLVHLADDSGLVRQAEEAWARTSGAGAVNVEPPASVVSDQPAEAARSNGRSRGRRGRGGAQGAAETAPSADQAASPAEDAPEAQAGGRSRGGRRRGGREQAAETTPAPEANANGGALERIYEALVEAVRGGIAPGKDTAGAAGVKSRLTAALGSFNERDLGFSKFKDFLEAAQRAGKVRVETAGAATRVGLPGDAGA